MNNRVDVDFRNESVCDDDSSVYNIERLFRGRRISVIYITCWEPDEARDLIVEIDTPSNNAVPYPALRIEGQRIVLCDLDLAGAVVMHFTAGRSSVEVALRLPDWA